jgi:hypothetical protein
MAKKSTSVVVTLTMLVVLVAALVFIGSSTGLVTFQAVGAPVPGAPVTPSAPSLQTCQGLTTLGLYAAVRNPVSPSTQYLSTSVNIVNANNLLVATGTTVGGSSLSYGTAISVPCTSENFNGNLYVLAAANQTSAKATYTIAGTAANVIVDAPLAGQVNLTFLDYNTGVNTSVQNAVTTEEAASAMSSGQTRNFKILVTPGVTQFAQFGSTEFGGVICIDTVNSAVFTDKAVALTSSDIALTEVDCTQYPKMTAVESCNRCYKIPAINSNMAAVTVNGKVSNDGGTSAGASDDPVVYFNDVNYFQDIDSTIKVGTFDSAGTKVGVSQVKATLNNS